MVKRRETDHVDFFAERVLRDTAWRGLLLRLATGLLRSQLGRHRESQHNEKTRPPTFLPPHHLVIEASRPSGCPGQPPSVVTLPTMLHVSARASIRTLALAGTLAAALPPATAQPPRINTDELPRLEAFSHATRVGDLIFVAGTLGTVGQSFDLASGGIGAETTQALRNIETILEEAGSDLAHVAKCTVYVTDMDGFNDMNAAYVAVFGDSPPARATIESPTLALGAAVEIECIAERRRSQARQARREQMDRSRRDRERGERNRERGERRAAPNPVRGTLQVPGGGADDAVEETIYYEVTGDGEPLVLSHGAGGNHAIWFEQVAFFSRRYQVITWDQRSFGNSTDHAGRHDPASFAADLLALLDHLGIEKAHLAGQSMGGWTTARFALDHPDRVRSIILADTTGGFATDAARADYERLTSGAARDEAAQWIADGRIDQAPMRSFLYGQISSLNGERPTDIGQSLFAADYTPRASELTSPVLVIFGSADPLFRAPTLRGIADLFSDAHVVQIPGAGHSPYFYQPAQWNRAVLEFLRDVE